MLGCIGWAETKELWASEHGDAADPIDRTGVTYRGEPPDWWFEADGSDIFRVFDGFLSEEEVANALEKLSCEANVRGRAHSGFDMVCQVSGDVMRRLRQQIDAEGAVEGREPAGQPQQEEEQELVEVLVEVPARVCPASKSVPQHKDKPDGKGAAVAAGRTRASRTAWTWTTRRPSWRASGACSGPWPSANPLPSRSSTPKGAAAAAVAVAVAAAASPLAVAAAAAAAPAAAAAKTQSSNRQR